MAGKSRRRLRWFVLAAVAAVGAALWRSRRRDGLLEQWPEPSPAPAPRLRTAADDETVTPPMGIPLADTVATPPLGIPRSTAPDADAEVAEVAEVEVAEVEDSAVATGPSDAEPSDADTGEPAPAADADLGENPLFTPAGGLHAAEPGEDTEESDVPFPPSALDTAEPVAVVTSAAAEPKPAPAEQDSALAEPESAVDGPEPAADEPEAVAAEPDRAAAEPEAHPDQAAEPADRPVAVRPSPTPRPRREATAGGADPASAPEGGSGSAPAMADGSAPGPEYTIKGTAASMLFHRPDSPSYPATRAEVWFRTATDARAAGFTEWTPTGSHDDRN